LTAYEILRAGLDIKNPRARSASGGRVGAGVGD